MKICLVINKLLISIYYSVFSDSEYVCRSCQTLTSLLNGRIGLQGLTAPPFSSKHSMAYKQLNVFLVFLHDDMTLFYYYSHGRYNVFHEYSSFSVCSVNCCVFRMCHTFIRVGAWDPDLCLGAGEQSSSCCEWIRATAVAWFSLLLPFL